MRVVGDHGEHVEIAALPHVPPHLDCNVQALVLLLLEQLVLVVGLREDLALFLRPWKQRVLNCCFQNVFVFFSWQRCRLPSGYL